MRSLANTVRRKKSWVTAEILNLCDKKRKPRKKRFEPEGSEKYKEASKTSRDARKRQKKTKLENSVVKLKKI